MKLQPYIIQLTRDQFLPIFDVPRVDYDALLNSLTFPLLWTFDDLLEGWIPREVDNAFLNWLRMDYLNSTELPSGRLAQLQRYGLVLPEERLTLTQLKEEMEQKGFVRIPQLLNGAFCKTQATQYFFRNEQWIGRWRDLEGIKRTSANNIPLMRLVHQLTESLINKLVSEPIKTSYSFTSAYETGTILPAHTDRAQCVWNVSMMLGSNPGNAELSKWPLYVRRNGIDYEIPLEAGDAVLYSGVRDLHYRHMLPAEIDMVLGVFLHYVHKDFVGSLD